MSDDTHCTVCGDYWRDCDHGPEGLASSATVDPADRDGPGGELPEVVDGIPRRLLPDAPYDGMGYTAAELALLANDLHVRGKWSPAWGVLAKSESFTLRDSTGMEVAWGIVWTTGGDDEAISWTDGVTGQWAVGFTLDEDPAPDGLAALYLAALRYIVAHDEGDAGGWGVDHARAIIEAYPCSIG